MRPKKKKQTELKPVVNKQATTTDPMLSMMQQMLDKFDNMDKRIQNLEQTKSAPAVADENAKYYNPDYKATKDRPYKVLYYSSEYVDANWVSKKNYQLPGRTFKNREAAEASVKNTTSKYDIIPV